MNKSKKGLVIVVCVCIVIAAIVAGGMIYHSISGAGGFERIDHLNARSFPGQTDLRVEFSARGIVEDTNDLYGQNFLYKKGEDKLCEALIESGGFSGTQRNPGGSVVLLINKDGEYYSLRRTDYDSNIYLFTGMAAEFMVDVVDYTTFKIPLPYHLIEDSRVCCVLPDIINGVPYQCYDDTDADNERERFVEFYREVGCSVEALNDAYTVTLPDGNAFELSFSTEAGLPFFTIESVDA